MPRGATDGMVKEYAHRNAPCSIEQRATRAGGLAGATLPAGLKGVDPSKGITSVARGDGDAVLWQDSTCQYQIIREPPLPISSLYQRTQMQLAHQLPHARNSHIATLSAVLIGVVQSVSGQLGKIARAMPLLTTQQAKEQRLRRFLDNPRITQEGFYQPLVQQALHGVRGQRVQLLIDRLLLRNTHNLLVVSIGFRRRSIPLLWKALPHRGSSGFNDQQALLQAALALLPPGVRVSVHGDREFRSRKLFQWLRTQGCDAMLGLRGNGRIYPPGAPHTAGQVLVTLVPSLDQPPRVGRHRHRRRPVA